MAAPLRALIWCAVSSREQAKAGKISLNLQEAAARAECEKQGWTILEPPFRMAHSRNYLDMNKWAESLRKQGDNSGYRLFELWENKGFDVLIVETPERLGSTGSMISRMIEEAMQAGAWIRVLRGVDVTIETEGPQTGMITMLTKMRMTRLRLAFNDQMDARAGKGAPVGRYPSIAFTVKKELDRTDDRIIVREDVRHYWHDLATVLLDGVPAIGLDRELYERYGHVNPNTGRRFNSGFMYRILHNPHAWGHSFRHWLKDGYKAYPTWTYDETLQPPPPIQVWRNTHEALWTGDEAIRVKNELDYRHSIVVGRASTKTPFRFTGLCICDLCSYRLMSNKIPKRNNQGYYIYWRCSSTDKSEDRGRACSERGFLRDEAIQEFIDDMLDEIFALSDPSSFFQALEAPDTLHTAEQVRGTILRLEARLSTYIDQKADAVGNSDILRLYSEKIAAAAEQLDLQRARLLELESAAEAPRLQLVRSHAVEEIKSMSREAFWDHEPSYINRLLNNVLGKYRLVVRDRQVVAIREGLTRGVVRKSVLSETEIAPRSGRPPNM